MDSIFDFADYRLWLRNYCEERRKTSHAFSYRSLGRKLGFSSPNFLQQVIEGKKNLGPEGVACISKGFRLGKKASKYLSILAAFAREKDTGEKDRLFAQILRYKGNSSAAKICADQFEYYGSWYNCVIRELAAGLRFDSIDYAELAARTDPPILPKQAKKSVALLLKLGLLVLDEHNYLRQSSPHIATDNETRSLVVRNYHDQMIDLGRRSLRGVPPQAREVSSVTMRISKQGFERIRQRVQEFREEIVAQVAADNGVDRVYQLNLQFFPVSQRSDERSLP